MVTGITTRAGSLVAGIVMLTGAAILHGGVAAADPQDDQFLALLSQKGIPALQGVPHLIATAHRICRNLDGGASASSQVDAMRNHAYDTDASDARQYHPERLTRTFTRFVTAAIQAYCPGDQGKIASIMAYRAPGSNEPMFRAVAYTHNNGVNSGSDVRESATLIAEIPPPNPPQIPPQPPAAAQMLPPPPQPVAAPPPPKRPPPPPQQPPPPPRQPPPPPQQPATPLRQAPPPPQQVLPPAVGPQSGGAAGGGGMGGGGNGGGGPTGIGGGDDSPGVVKVAP